MKNRNEDRCYLCQEDLILIEVVWKAIRTRRGMIFFGFDGIIKFLSGYRRVK